MYKIMPLFHCSTYSPLWYILIVIYYLVFKLLANYCIAQIASDIPRVHINAKLAIK